MPTLVDAETSPDPSPAAGGGDGGAPSSRTALVLGGGGFTAGVYEIGALRALDLLSVNRTVNQFDIYVGTSAGAYVASMAANGVTPEQMMALVNSRSRTVLRDRNVSALLRPNYKEFAVKGAQLPLHLLGLARMLIRARTSISPVDLAVALAEALPSGLYTGAGIERHVRELFSEEERSDDFRKLAATLLLPTTDLDTCERVVLGSPGWDDVPISTAVRASGAFPMLYQPVEVKGRTLLDGGIHSTTNIDLAVAAGAQLVVVINPLVPFVNDFSQEMKTVFGTRTRRVAEMGFPKIGAQTFKLLAHSRLHEAADEWRARYPGVDIVLIEPEPDDELMFETNIMDYAARVDVARHGFRSVTLKLADEYDELRKISQRHGIELSPTRVRRVVEHFTHHREQTSAWKRILGQTTGALLRQSSGDRKE